MRTLDLPDLDDDFYTTTVDWSPVGQVAVVLGRSVLVWDANTGASQELFNVVEEHLVTAIRWAPDPRYLAVGSASGLVWVVDISSGTARFIRTLSAHRGRVLGLDWAGPILASAAEDGLVRVWDVRATTGLVATLRGHASAVVNVRWSPDGTQLASGGADNLVCVWNRSQIEAAAHAEPTPGRLVAHTAAVRALAWSPHEPRRLATGGGQGDAQLVVWDTEALAPLRRALAPCQITDALWSRHEDEIVTSHGYYDNSLVIWSAGSLSRAADLRAHTGRVAGLSASPDGSVVCSMGGEEICFWQLFQRRGPRSRRLLDSRQQTSKVAVPRGMGYR